MPAVDCGRRALARPHRRGGAIPPLALTAMAAVTAKPPRRKGAWA